VGAYWALTGLDRFRTHFRELAEAGVTGLVAFRSRLMTPPSSWVLGDWLTVLLLALPFACAAAAWLWQTRRQWLAGVALAPVAALAATLSVSCSRAVFWSMVLFFSVACGFLAAGRIVRLRTTWLWLASALAVLCLIVAVESALYPGLWGAYTGRQTSQARSTEGRIGIWKRSTELIRAHPLWGVGSSNAALALTSTADQEDSSGFASRTFSLPVQVLVEKGIIVFLLYCVFLVLAGREFVRTLRSEAPKAAKAMVCCFAAGLVAVLARELTYSSLFEHAATLALAAVLVALVVEVDGEEKAGDISAAVGKADRLAKSGGSVPPRPGRQRQAEAPAPRGPLPRRGSVTPCPLPHGRGSVTDGTPEVVAKASLWRVFLRILTMRTVTLMLALAVVVLHFFFIADYDRADDKLRSFYSQMVAADFGGARASIDEAIRLWPGNARYYTWRGYAISQNLPPQCPRAGGALAAADREAAREAIADYRHALQLNARDAVARHNLAWLEHLLGNDVAAGKDWREAVAIDPGNAVFHLSYAMFLDETDGFDKAVVRYETAIELSPAILDSPFFARYRARFPEAAGAMVAHCVARLEGKLRRESDPIVEARLGKMYLYTGDLQRAAALLEGAAGKLPNLPLVWLNLGEVRQTQGDSAGALDCYRKARVVDGGLAGPYLRMGEITLAAGERGAAAEYLRTAVARWEWVNPITAAHNNRLYVGPMQRIDDLLPTTLVWYTTPCEASRAWGGLAEMFPENQRYASRRRTCEALPAVHSLGRVE
jgi:tetratricopeptide (TPR) repeat protein